MQRLARDIPLKCRCRVKYKFSQKNELDEFWRRHTIGSGNDSSKRTLPSFIIENGFVQTIEPTLRLLEKSLDSSILTIAERDASTRGLDDSPISFGTIVQLARNLQLMLLERDAAIGERDVVVNFLTWRYTTLFRRILRYARTCIKSVM